MNRSTANEFRNLIDVTVTTPKSEISSTSLEKVVVQSVVKFSIFCKKFNLSILRQLWLGRGHQLSFWYSVHKKVRSMLMASLDHKSDRLICSNILKKKDRTYVLYNKLIRMYMDLLAFIVGRRFLLYRIESSEDRKVVNVKKVLREIQK